MQKDIKVTFLVNAAVLLEYDDTKFLIDGIYDKTGHNFSSLSLEKWEKMKAGNEIFSDIKYLLFTHEHGDHFSPERVCEYLQKQRPKAIFMPKNNSEGTERVEKTGKAQGIACVLLEKEFCQKTYFQPEKEIRIKAYRTVHLDKEDGEIEHYCYLIQCGDKNLLFTADAEFHTEKFEAFLNLQLEAVFVNPVLYLSRRGKELLENGGLKAKRVVVYHIPSAEDDHLGLRKMMERRKTAATEGTVFFMEEGQELPL